MKSAVFLIVFLITLTMLIFPLPVFASESSQAKDAGNARISELYSDIESFDITLYSEEPEENLTLEAVILTSKIKGEKNLGRQVFSIDSLPANTRVIKVGFWDPGNAERGAYHLRASLYRKEELLSEAEYEFTYGAQSVSRLRVNDLVLNSEGVSVALSPVEAVLFDIEYMLVDGPDVVYTTKSEKLSLTSTPEIFSATWGTLLENNREYLGRVKIQVYSPKKELIESTESFTARDDAEITDIFEDETGASATVFGRSQVPFKGNLVFTVYTLEENGGAEPSEPVESVRERVPVLINGDDETIEVSWNQKLPGGVYRLTVELVGNDGDVLERRETVIESGLPSDSYVNGEAQGSATNGTQEENGGGIPGFSAGEGLAGLVGLAGLAGLSAHLRKRC